MMAYEHRNFRAYKGYFVTAYPYELQAGGWSAEFDLSSDRGGDIVVTGFYGSCIFPSEDEAIRAALHSACRRIEAGFTPGDVQ
jgi:hypothetical protein